MGVPQVKAAGQSANVSNEGEAIPLLNRSQIETGEGHIRSRVLSLFCTAAMAGHAFNGFVKIYFLALPLTIYYFHPSLDMIYAAVVGITISSAHVLFLQLEKHYENNVFISSTRKIAGFIDDVLLEGVEKTGLIWITCLEIAHLFPNHSDNPKLIPNITLPIAAAVGFGYMCLMAGKYIRCKKHSFEAVDKAYPATWGDIVKGFADAFGSLSYSFLVLQKFGVFSKDSPLNLMSPLVPVALFATVCAFKRSFFMGPKILIMLLDFLKNLSLSAAFLDFGFSIYAATHKNDISTQFLWIWGSTTCFYALFTCLTMLVVQAYLVHNAANYDLEKLWRFPQALVEKFKNMLPRSIDDQVIRTGSPNFIRLPDGPDLINA